MNSNGYEGLIPEFGGGRPSKLTEEQKEKLKEMLKKKNSWTTKEVQELIEEEFGVSYSSLAGEFFATYVKAKVSGFYSLNGARVFRVTELKISYLFSERSETPILKKELW